MDGVLLQPVTDVTVTKELVPAKLPLTLTLPAAKSLGAPLPLFVTDTT